jgi:hypothetical protein
MCREGRRPRRLTCFASMRSPRWRGAPERRHTDRVEDRVEERGFGARERSFWYTTAKIKTNTDGELSSEALSSAGVVEAM